MNHLDLPSPGLTVQHHLQVLDACFDAVLVLHYPPQASEATITYANQSALFHTGHTHDSLVGKNPDLLLHPRIRENTYAHLKSRMQQLESTQSTILGKSLTGSLFWAEIKLTPLDLSHHLWMLVARDVTSQVGLTRDMQVSQVQLKQLLEHSDSVLRIMQQDGRYTYTSPSCEALFGYTATELNTMGFSHYVHPEDLTVLLENHQDRKKLGLPHHPGPFEYRIVCKDGTLKWVSTASREMQTSEDPSEVVYLVTTIDITHRKKAEMEARERVQRYEALLDLTYQIETEQDPDVLASRALQEVLPLTEYEFGVYIKIQQQQVSLECCVGVTAAQVQPIVLQALQGISPAEVKRRLGGTRPIFRHQHHLQHEPGVLGTWARSLAALPIHEEDTLFGVLLLGSSREQVVSVGSQKLLVAINERLNLAYARLIDRENLHRAREETLRAMGLVLEYRDFETKGHTDRVTRLATQLGEKLGVSATELDDLRLGAYLHDIGKVAIPDHVLLKPGKLDPQEWHFIKQHPRTGFELLHHIPTLSRGVLDIVLHHQERWNGSGYPGGLLQEEIPLMARIFAVVDVFDALISERPYKRAFTREEAIAQVLCEAGTLLDPQVATAFVQMLHQMEA